MKHFKSMLPDFPGTPHLPYKPNMAAGDTIAANALVFGSSVVSVQEKIDGSNCGMALIDDHPVIRNRTKILTKGYYKNTQAKRQFLPIWGWFYDNKDKFLKLESECPGLSVYGDWMLFSHGVRYDLLPDWFVTYDIYDYENKRFLSPGIALPLLQYCGFATVEEIYVGPVKDWAQLEGYCNQSSCYSSTELREGVYVKVVDNNTILRYKMVREGFVQGALWQEGTKNSLRSSKS